MFSNRQLAKLRALLTRRKPADDLEEEIRSHLRMEEQENLEAGMFREEAHYAALRRFGNVTLTQERSQEMWKWNLLETFFQDVRYGLRQLRKSPGFTIVAVLTLALGIGANMAMFNLVDAALLRGIPARDPSQLVELYTINPALSFFPYNFFSYQMLEETVRTQRVFSEVNGWSWTVLPFEISGQTFPGSIAVATGNYFQLLGLRPAIGRLLMPEDDEGPTPSHNVVIGYGFWQTHYDGRPSVLGKILKIDGHPCTIVGVAPRDFFGLSTGASLDAWLPLVNGSRKDEYLFITARLKDGTSIGRARAQIETLWPSILAATVPSKIGAKERRLFLAQRIRVVSAKTGLLAPSLSPFRQPLIVLMCAATIVLLLACLNLASIMLSRAVARQHEMGVRAALGASRRRLVQQALTESTLLSVPGTLLAIPLALWISQSLASFVWTGATSLGLNLTLSSQFLEFAAVAAFLTAILIGFAPAWQTTQHGAGTLLQENPSTLTGGSGRGLGKSALAVQLALTFVLLIGAGLMTRSLAALFSIKPGFRTEGILTLLLQPNPGGYKDFDPQIYYEQLMQNLAALPGVRSVSLSRLGPIEPIEPRFPVARSPSDAPTKESIDAVWEAVSPGFFQTLGIHLLRGRDFEFNDGPHAIRVAIVGESLARRLFSAGEAIGHLIDVGSEPGQQNLRIVGVVSDANLYNVEIQRPPAVYLPFSQLPDPVGGTLEIHTAGKSQEIEALAERRINALGREYVFRAQTVQRAVSRSLAREQALVVLADGYGGLALLLATFGLYGVLSYSVARRTHEIGIRMALGAQKSDVLRMIVGQGIKLALVGVGIGIVGALALTRFLSSLLYSVKPMDPLTFIAVSLILIAVALLACFIPARRASKVDPMVALRYE